MLLRPGSDLNSRWSEGSWVMISMFCHGFSKSLHRNWFPSSSTPFFRSFGRVFKSCRLFCWLSPSGRLLCSGWFYANCFLMFACPVVGKPRCYFGCSTLGCLQFTHFSSLSTKFLVIEGQEESIGFQFLSSWTTVLVCSGVESWFSRVCSVRFWALCELATNFAGLVARPSHQLATWFVLPLQTPFFSPWFQLTSQILDSIFVVWIRAGVKIVWWVWAELTQESVLSLGELVSQQNESSWKTFGVIVVTCRVDFVFGPSKDTFHFFPRSISWLRQLFTLVGPGKFWISVFVTLLQSESLTQHRLRLGTCQVLLVSLGCIFSVSFSNRAVKQPQRNGFKKLPWLAHFRDHTTWQNLGLVFALRLLGSLCYVHYVFYFVVCSFFVFSSRSSFRGHHLRSFSSRLHTFLRDVLLGHFHQLLSFFRRSTSTTVVGLTSCPGFLYSWYGWNGFPTYYSNGRLLLWVAGRDGLSFKVHGLFFVRFHLFGLTEKKREGVWSKWFYGFRSANSTSEGKQESFSDPRKHMQRKMEVPSKTISSPTEAIPMNGGDGRNSYANNSSLQRFVVDMSKSMIDDAIANYLDIKICPSSNTFRIADLGCSIGPNTFIAMQNIIEAIHLKYRKSGSTPEFHVYFNDHTSNDFNTLFVSLPPEKPYFAAGVPGSFHTRLFPKASLHIVHSSTALQWLSQVPKEVLDNSSPAYNKGRIHYINAKHQVFEAYSAQYAKDIEAFLHARAEEVVRGGLVVLTVPAIPDETPPSQLFTESLFDILGSCLLDIAKTGTVEEAKVDSFNVPVYSTTPRELKKLIERNGCFSMEQMMEILPLENKMRPHAQTFSDHIRAATEGVIKSHFGCNDHIIDHLFQHLYPKKFEDTFTSLPKSMGKTTMLFVLLKRI